jgi:chromosome segregation ATPase
MYGFGTIQPKNINQIVTALEKQINDIKSSYASDYSVISNKIEKCETYLSKLKEYIKVVQDYTETEYQKLQTQIESFESQISELKENLNQVNYSKAGQETVAVGIAPLNEYSDTGVTHPFSAKYAVNDSEGNNIVGTYATKDELNNAGQQYSTELSSVSATLQENIATEVNRATESEQYLTDNLTGEVTRSMGAENTISADLGKEVSRATNKEIQLQQSIETLTNTVNDKENSLSAQIEAETTRATTKENELDTAISNETTNRIYADSDLQTQINALTASLPVIVDSFTSAINAEEARATETEEALDDKIDSSVETLNGTISELNTTLHTSIPLVSEMTKDFLHNMSNILNRLSDQNASAFPDPGPAAAGVLFRKKTAVRDVKTEKMFADQWHRLIG